MPPPSLERDQPLVSIILPSYLGTPAQAELLHQTLRTISAQRCTDREVILVDDGSPVSVGPVAASYPRTTVVRHCPAAPAVARNTGITQSWGRYLVFLDADGLLLPVRLGPGSMPWRSILTPVLR
ncbi:glycosyltransferase family 2 protein [Microvirga pakistanensis]|uniref:glycosyltransferase family 2 protein n=1 Tax=Microvirga pakistanensis TaxID=1682650 RepID=UPI00141B162A|nr:glycosyltransferase family A protein [Microvirga pakistanensis]